VNDLGVEGAAVALGGGDELAVNLDRKPQGELLDVVLRAHLILYLMKIT
jgi:hypothetical protein